MKNPTKQYLFICQSKSCLKAGSEYIRAQIKQHIKEKGFKKELKIVNTKCMDACEQGPNVVCGNYFYQEVTTEKIEEIVNLYVATHVGKS